jgi:hypothetical protein
VKQSVAFVMARATMNQVAGHIMRQLNTVLLKNLLTVFSEPKLNTPSPGRGNGF